jgi:hypothetical protein
VLTGGGDGRELQDFEGAAPAVSAAGGGGFHGRRRSGTRLASGIGGGDVARRRRLHGGLSFLRSTPWPADRGRPAAVVLGSDELRG